MDAPSPLHRNKLISLASFTGDLTSTTIFVLAEKIKALSQNEVETHQTIRVAIGGDLTTSFMARSVIFAFAQEGVHAIIYETPYGAYIQEILDPGSNLYRFEPDILLIAPDWRHVVIDATAQDTEAHITDELSSKVSLLRRLWSTAETELGCIIIQQTIVPPTWGPCGLAERKTAASEHWQVNFINQEIIKASQGSPAIFDVGILAESVGLRNWAPDRLYIYGKLPFDSRYMPEYAQMFKQVWRSTAGRDKKCLILDLDNTLWSGIIGDDGLDGIKIGSGTIAGEAFAEWQRHLVRLKRRGIVLAICSKNNPQIAFTGFEHSGSVLKIEDFSAISCGWEDKAVGIKNIAKELNLGLNSFVFCDDNPAECALIRQELPEVGVVELGDDPNDFIRRLEINHWFSKQSLTPEDANRSEMYAIRHKAIKTQQASTDICSFLLSLKMIGMVFRPSEPQLERLAQLEAKTNQFNLLTPRLNVAQIRSFVAATENIVYAANLSDIYGDHGTVSSLIATRTGDSYEIISWVMSCRVFSRTLEQFMMERLIATARKAGAKELIGRYQKTEKNEVVENLYESLGFISKKPGIWSLDLSSKIELLNFVSES